MKKKKKKFVQTELLSLFRIKWKLVSGPHLDWFNKTRDGVTNFPALTAEEAEVNFLKAYNIAGRTFKIISVTEIQKGKVKPTTHNQEHEKWDTIPT